MSPSHARNLLVARPEQNWKGQNTELACVNGKNY